MYAYKNICSLRMFSEKKNLCFAPLYYISITNSFCENELGLIWTAC